MKDIEQLIQVLQALTTLYAMPDFLGKDDVEKHLRWAAKNYAERIFSNSRVEN